jgi:predicted nucleic acid-binding protein
LSFLLDTNIVSQKTKLKPHPKVFDWLMKLPQEQAFLSVVTIQKSRTGFELLDRGKRRRDLEAWFDAYVLGGYAGRILLVTEEIADLCGRFVAVKRKLAETPDINDMLIAATAVVHELTLATLNEKHFKDLPVKLVKF